MTYFYRSIVLHLMSMCLVSGAMFDVNVYKQAKIKNTDVKEVESILRNLQETHDRLIPDSDLQKVIEGEGHIGEVKPKTPVPNGCACVNSDCGCCARIHWKVFDVNEQACANISYLSKGYGISLTVTFGKHTIINETISARNPPPICEQVPYLRKYASICIAFNNLHFGNSTFTGCIDIEARLLDVLKESYQLGCFKIPLKKTASIQPLEPQDKMAKFSAPPKGKEFYIKAVNNDLNRSN